MTKPDDPTPLAILLETMREKWAAGDRDGAALLAPAAAPYLHPRRAAVHQEADRMLEPDLLTDAELAERLLEIDRRAGIAPAGSRQSR